MVDRSNRRPRGAVRSEHRLSEPVMARDSRGARLHRAGGPPPRPPSPSPGPSDRPPVRAPATGIEGAAARSRGSSQIASTGRSSGEQSASLSSPRPSRLTSLSGIHRLKRASTSRRRSKTRSMSASRPVRSAMAPGCRTSPPIAVPMMWAASCPRSDAGREGHAHGHRPFSQPHPVRPAATVRRRDSCTSRRRRCRPSRSVPGAPRRGGSGRRSRISSTRRRVRRPAVMTPYGPSTKTRVPGSSAWSRLV